MHVKISEHDEHRLRILAAGMVQGIRDPADILKELGFDEDDWRELEKSRIFKRMMEEAQAEWNGAAGTAKRIKLKAGVNVELSLPQFYEDMNNPNQPLVARVRALEMVAKLAGLPEVETTTAAPGAQFKLEIHLGDNRVEVLQMGAIPEQPIVSPVLEHHESFKLPDYLVTLDE